MDETGIGRALVLNPENAGEIAETVAVVIWVENSRSDQFLECGATGRIGVGRDGAARVTRQDVKITLRRIRHIRNRRRTRVGDRAGDLHTVPSGLQIKSAQDIELRRKLKTGAIVGRPFRSKRGSAFTGLDYTLRIGE